MYYEGIVDSLKNQHKLSTDSLQQQLKDMNAIETQKGGKYKEEVRLLYYDLLTVYRLIQCNLL